MKALQMSVNLKPNLFEWVQMRARQKQLSYSGYVARLIEKDMENDDYVITREELERRSREAHEAIDKGTAKTFDNVEDCLRDLYEAADKINSIR